MADVFPPARQREVLLALRDALGVRDNALKRDECGDWRVNGRQGHIYAVPRAFRSSSSPVAASLIGMAKARISRTISGPGAA